MIPEIAQSDAERIQDARTNSVLIPDGNTVRPAGVATLVDETPLGGGDPIDVPQECVSPKIEELDPPKIKVEDVSDEDSDDKESRGYYVNSEGLRHFHRDHHQLTYPIVTEQSGGHYDEGPL